MIQRTINSAEKQYIWDPSISMEISFKNRMQAAKNGASIKSKLHKLMRLVGLKIRSFPQNRAENANF